MRCGEQGDRRGNTGEGEFESSARDRLQRLQPVGGTCFREEADRVLDLAGAEKSRLDLGLGKSLTAASIICGVAAAPVRSDYGGSPPGFTMSNIGAKSSNIANSASTLATSPPETLQVPSASASTSLRLQRDAVEGGAR
jgi:hypothetical protein